MNYNQIFQQAFNNYVNKEKNLIDQENREFQGYKNKLASPMINNKRFRTSQMADQMGRNLSDQSVYSSLKNRAKLGSQMNQGLYSSRINPYKAMQATQGMVNNNINALNSLSNEQIDNAIKTSNLRRELTQSDFDTLQNLTKAQNELDFNAFKRAQAKKGANDYNEMLKRMAGNERSTGAMLVNPLNLPFGLDKIF